MVPSNFKFVISHNITLATFDNHWQTLLIIQSTIVKNESYRLISIYWYYFAFRVFFFLASCFDSSVFSAVNSIEKAGASFANIKDLLKNALVLKQQLKQEETKRYQY